MKKDKKKNYKKKGDREQVAQAVKKKSEKFRVNHKAGILLGILAFLLYSNTIGFGYVLDDSAAIMQNLFVQKGFAGIPDLLKTEFWHFQNMHLGYYRPLSLISFAVEQQFFPGNPHVSHLGNVVFFAFGCYMLFIVLSNLFHTQNFLFSFAITLLFLAHPIHTEVVANVKSRDELLSFLNILLMTWFALRFYDSKKNRFLLLSVFFFYLALLSKETALTGAILLPVFLFFYDKISIATALKKTVPHIILVFVFFLQKRYLMGSTGAQIPDDIVNYPYAIAHAKIPMAFFFFAFSLKLLFIPHPLRYDYSYNQIPAVGILDITVWIGIFLFIAVVITILKYYKKRSPLILALIVFFIGILPLMAFITLRGGIFAERFLYLPSLGLAIGLTSAIGLLFKTGFTETLKSPVKYLKSAPAFSLVMLLVSIMFSIKTFSRSHVWKDEITLYNTDIKTGENSVQNHKHLGTELLRLGRLETDSLKKAALCKDAIQQFRTATDIHPKFGECYSELGVIYEDVFVNFDSAIYYYNKAIRSSPSLVFPYYNLGTVYHRMGQYNVASYYYNQAIKVNPQYQSAITARDNLKQALGLNIQINPLGTKPDSLAVDKSSMGYFNSGNYYAGQGDYPKAAEQFQSAINLDPKNIDAYINLANCYGMMKNYDKAISISGEALKINPNNTQLLENIATSYRIMGNTQKADEYTRKANALKNQ